MTKAERKAKNQAAAALGKLGGIARAKGLSPERRREIAAQGGKARARNAKKNAAKLKALEAFVYTGPPVVIAPTSEAK